MLLLMMVAWWRATRLATSEALPTVRELLGLQTVPGARIGDDLVLATGAGEVLLVQAAAGKVQELAFLPGQEFGPPVTLPSSVLVASCQGKVYRLGYAGEAPLWKIWLRRALTGRVAVTDESVWVAGGKYLFKLALSTGAMLENSTLPAYVACGPCKWGEAVVVGTQHKGLLVFTAEASQAPVHLLEAAGGIWQLAAFHDTLYAVDEAGELYALQLGRAPLKVERAGRITSTLVATPNGIYALAGRRLSCLEEGGTLAWQRTLPEWKGLSFSASAEGVALFDYTGRVQLLDPGGRKLQSLELPLRLSRVERLGKKKLAATTFDGRLILVDVASK